MILFSHGSLLCGAGEQLELHAARLRQDAGYSSVEIGYLNYSSPSFGDAVEKCVNAGATKILISPYFLIPGYFIKVGLPRVLAPERERFPHIEFEIAPVLGDHELLAQAVSRCAANAQTSENWRAILHSAPKSCERNSECPLFEKCALTPRPPLPRGERGGELCGMGSVSPLVIGINTFVTPSPAPRERGSGGEGNTFFKQRTFGISLARFRRGMQNRAPVFRSLRISCTTRNGLRQEFVIAQHGRDFKFDIAKPLLFGREYSRQTDFDEIAGNQKIR